MAEPSKDRPHSIRWDRADWDRLEEAAQVLSERQHLDLAPVDIIRSGARQFVNEILGIKPVEPERRASERRQGVA